MSKEISAQRRFTRLLLLRQNNEKQKDLLRNWYKLFKGLFLYYLMNIHYCLFHPHFTDFLLGKCGTDERFQSQVDRNAFESCENYDRTDSFCYGLKYHHSFMTRSINQQGRKSQVNYYVTPPGEKWYFCTVPLLLTKSYLDEHLAQFGTIYGTQAIFLFSHLKRTLEKKKIT